LGKALGNDVDGLELDETWPVDKPECLNDLRPLLDKIRNRNETFIGQVG
jgi:hypothetical protein